MNDDMQSMRDEFLKLARLEGNEPIRCSRMHFDDWAETIDEHFSQIAALTAERDSLAAKLAAVKEAAHQIMNLELTSHAPGYCFGHRDARHAASELLMSVLSSGHVELFATDRIASLESQLAERTRERNDAMTVAQNIIAGLRVDLTAARQRMAEVEKERDELRGVSVNGDLVGNIYDDLKARLATEKAK